MKAHKVEDVLLVRAQALAKAEVVKLRFDPLLAKGACHAGLTYLAPYRELLDSRHFDSVLLDGLPALCDRIVEVQNTLAKTRTQGKTKVTDVVDAALAWRRKLMPIAEALGANEKLDSAELERIRSGVGAVDNVTDVIDLTALLESHRSKVFEICGPSALNLAQESARAALQVLRLGSPDTEATRQAAELRDRYATLVERGHDRLRVAVATLTSFSEAEEIVKSLNSGRSVTKTKEPELPTTKPAVTA